MIIDIINEEVTMFGLLDEDVILHKVSLNLLNTEFSSLCTFI
jgi:hypothetical protein